MNVTELPINKAELCKKKHKKNMFGWLFGSKKGKLKEAFDNGAVVIDVRTKEEFKQGRFGKSKNIPLNKINKNLKAIKAMNKTVILVCRSGGRAGSAKRMLDGAGIECINGGGWTDFQKVLREA